MILVMSLIPPPNSYPRPSAPPVQFLSYNDWEFPHALVFVIAALGLLALGLRRSAAANRSR